MPTGPEGQARSRTSSSARSRSRTDPDSGGPSAPDRRATPTVGDPAGRPGAAEQDAGLPAPPRPGVLRPLPALQPADLPGVPATGRGRRPVRRLRRAAGQDGAPGGDRLRGPGHRRPPGRHVRDHRHLRGAGSCCSWSVPGLDRATISFAPVLGQSEPWRFLTSAFAHGEHRSTSCSTCTRCGWSAQLPRAAARAAPGSPRCT